MTIGVVTTAIFTALGFVFLADRSLKLIGFALFALSGAWLAGLLFADHWLWFGFLAGLAGAFAVGALIHIGGAAPATATAATDEVTAAPPPERQVWAVTRADEYNAAIESLELPAQRVDKTLQRFNTVFKDEDLAREVAQQRYGVRSPLYSAYVSTHGRRRQEFFLKLESGRLQHREIISLPDIQEWLRKPVHPAAAALRNDLVVRQVNCVVETLRKFPRNYSLALSEDEHPFRYGLFDSATVVLHDAIGASDMHRVNSLFVTDPATVKAFEDEFELVWQHIDPALKSNEEVALKLEELLEQAAEGVPDPL